METSGAAEISLDLDLENDQREVLATKLGKEEDVVLHT